MLSANLRPRLDALLARAAAEAWSPRTDIDWWGAAPRVPDGMATADYVDSVSQLWHAEKAALDVASALRGRLGDAGLEAFLATQIADEDRHAQVLRGYLERLGDVAPVDPHLAAAYAHARAWTGPAWVPIAALDVMLALEVMPGPHRRLAGWRCPLMRQINARIAADEARHGAFGMLYLEHALPAATADDRAAGRAWLGALWELGTAAARARQRPAAPMLHPDRGAIATIAERAALLLRRLGVAADQPLFAAVVPA